MTATLGWTSAADIAAKVRRRWDDGSLLRAYAAGEPFPVIDIPVRGPRPGEIGDRLGEVQAWIEALEHGSLRGRRYELTHASVGGRLIGRNQLPSRAVVTSYDQAWSLLGVAADVARYDSVLTTTSSVAAVHRWATQEPFKALAQDEVWPQLLAAYSWLEAARGTGRRIRQIDAPGVDTKFVERHRAVLASLLGVPSSAAGFARELGLATAPETVRLRFDEGSPECRRASLKGASDARARPGQGQRAERADHRERGDVPVCRRSAGGRGHLGQGVRG